MVRTAAQSTTLNRNEPLIHPSESARLASRPPCPGLNPQLNLFQTGPAAGSELSLYLIRAQREILEQDPGLKTAAERVRTQAAFRPVHAPYPWLWPAAGSLAGGRVEGLLAPGDPRAPPSEDPEYLSRLRELHDEVRDWLAEALAQPARVMRNGASTRVELLDSLAFVASPVLRRIYLEVRDADGAWQLSRKPFRLGRPLEGIYWLRQALLPWTDSIERRFGQRALAAFAALVDLLEDRFESSGAMQATSRQIVHHLNPEAAVGHTLHHLARALSGFQPDSRDYNAVWQEAPAWRNLVHHYPRLVPLYRDFRKLGLLAEGAGLAGLRQLCRARGLGRAGWRFLVRHGLEIHRATSFTGEWEKGVIDRVLAYVDWMARAGLERPLPDAFAGSIPFEFAVKGAGGRMRIPIDLRLAGHLPELHGEAGNADEAEELEWARYREWRRVALWLMDGGGRLDRHQWRAGWPAIARAHQRWLQGRGDVIRWDPLVAAFRCENWQVRPLCGDQQLAQEGYRMHHCVADYQDDCADGTMRIFSVEHAETGKPAATVGLVRDGDSWRLDEARGRFNEEPATDVRPALEQLLRRARPRNG